MAQSTRGICDAVLAGVKSCPEALWEKDRSRFEDPKEPNFPQFWGVQPSTVTAGRIYMDWERWVREGIIDDLQIWKTDPPDLQLRTAENVLRATEGTSVSVGGKTCSPFADYFQPFTARGMRISLSCSE